MTEFSIYLNGPDALKAEILRQFGDKFAREDKILQLNREVASRNAEIAGLKVTLQRMRAAGGYVESEEIGALTEIIEERHPSNRVAKQRREIYNLHRVIKGLKNELRELRGE